MTEASTPMRVLLVDDQDLVRAGFRMILSVEPDIQVVGEASDGEQAVELALELRPDVVLMDVQMPGLDGIAATQRIVSADAGKVIILTTFDRDDYLFESLGAGASGFLLKNTAPEDLVEAIQVVHSGHALLAPEVTRRVIKRFAGGGDRIYRPDLVAALTEREREVLGLIARGLTNTEIATSLFVGEATVKTHVSRVLLKLGLRDRVQAVVFAYECGLVVPGDEH
ncbi:response regulator transcription factor [Streptomyces sp. SID13031]|uniref:response regulator n=1 Tax=Streptomyces sp. SID13031 TaxID=2706046 RepID=UPI0013CC2E2E|nr:response regulator transcription factor [Streptomyces sp. SID13031]NEA33572.1 response regulator transcription factor [Streptomyces sp. SID13031]